MKKNGKPMDGDGWIVKPDPAFESDRERCEHAKALAYIYTNYLCVLTLFCQIPKPSDDELARRT